MELDIGSISWAVIVTIYKCVVCIEIVGCLVLGGEKIIITSNDDIVQECVVGYLFLVPFCANGIGTPSSSYTRIPF